jgi:subtilisin family serine protease
MGGTQGITQARRIAIRSRRARSPRGPGYARAPAGLLPLLGPDERVKVLLWIGGVSYGWVDDELAQRYPLAQASYRANGQPFTAESRPVAIPTEFRGQIRSAYNDLLDEAHRKAAEPVAAFLRQEESQFVVLDAIPGLAAELTADEIKALDNANLDNLSTVYYGELEFVPQMDSATGTIRAAPVWDMGYTGDFTGLTTWSGDPIRLGILDGGPVGFPLGGHPAFSGKTIIEPAYGGPPRDHAAQVAGVMFGNDAGHPEYRGVAWGSWELVTLGTVDFTWQDLNSKLNLLVDNYAWIINVSLGTDGSRWMQAEDRAFDYVVRYRDPTVVVSAGNHLQCSSDWNVCSPGKGHNVITVGAIKDNNNAQWQDDEMWENSCYKDPYYDDTSGQTTFSKPDIVAVGDSVNVVGDGGSYVPLSGTSFAAPQVAGLAACWSNAILH